MAELREFRLPDVGEGLTEADIVSWHVKPGDQVEVNQVIVEIETAKAVVELPSPWDGTVARLLVAEGQTAEVGTPIIAVDVSATGPAAGGTADSAERAVVPAPVRPTLSQPTLPPAEAARPRSCPARTPERQPVLVGYGVKAAATTRRARKTAAVPAPALSPQPARGPGGPGAGQAAGAPAGQGPRHRAGRAVRHRARRHHHPG